MDSSVHFNDRSARVLAPLLAILCIGACVSTDTSECLSGRICPTTLRCSADGQDCIVGLCGNGLIDADEACDDGNVRDGDDCSADCLTITACGNGVLDNDEGVFEVCDDGNNINGDGCSEDCQSDETCGNGVLDRPVDEACDDGNLTPGDGCNASCRLESCGDGIIDQEAGETCDDGNLLAGDYCSPICRVETALSAGGSHTCALLDTGKVRCWGVGYLGQLGHANDQAIGDDETPASAGDIDVGGLVYQISAGFNHTCAILDTGALRCWGEGLQGRLGYGNENNIGDNETPAEAGDVDVGGPVLKVSAGSNHTCVLLENHRVKCFGKGQFGVLGYGNTENIGDDELPTSVGDVQIGGDVVQIAAGTYHTCVLLDGGAIRCWGLANIGRLGYGNGAPIGDDELPSSAGDVQVGGNAVKVVVGDHHTCALLEGGSVRCWGWGDVGQTGYGNRERLGDNEFPYTAGDVQFGAPVLDIAAYGSHTCVQHESDKFQRELRCWGWNQYGQLGYGNTDNIGDDELPSTVSRVEIGGGAVMQFDLGDKHSCALLTGDAIRCWGLGGNGRLGHNLGNIGDDEVPSFAGDVPYR